MSGNERDDGLTQPPTAIVYWPMLNESYRWRTMAYAVRSTRVGAPGFVRELEQAVWSVNPNLPLATVQTLEEIQASSMTQTSFALVMLGIAASVALLIGMVGIYGVVAYAATQRTREIGVRMALGAQIGDVRKMFLRHGLWLTTIGIAIGIGIALVLTRVMSAFLFGVGPMDPITYAAVSAVLAGMTLVATYLPAHRASRVDPQERHEARLGADGIEDGIPTDPRHHLRIGREGPLEVVERAGAVAKTEVHKRQVERQYLAIP